MHKKNNGSGTKVGSYESAAVSDEFAGKLGADKCPRYQLQRNRKLSANQRYARQSAPATVH